MVFEKEPRDFERGDEQATFNMAVAYLKRIDYLLNTANSCSMNDDLPAWFKTLKAIYREIVPKLLEDEEKKIKTLIDDTNKVLNKHGITRVAFPYPQKFYGEIYPKLDELDTTLRKLINKKGLLMPKSSDPRFALGRF